MKYSWATYELDPDSSVSELVERTEKARHAGRDLMFQFKTRLPDELIAAIADVARRAPDTAVRIYSAPDPGGPELEWLQGLDHIRHLLIECWRDVTTFDGVTRFRKLQSLMLGATKSQRPSLDFLCELPDLTNLRLEGHSKGAEAIGRLPRLRWLNAREVKDRAWLARIGPQPSVEALALSFGGIRDLGVLGEWSSLRRLELMRITRLDSHDLMGLSDSGTLKELWLHNLQQVTRLSFATGKLAESLTQLFLYGMNALETLDDVAGLNRLERLDLLDARPADRRLDAIGEITSLRSLSVNQPYSDDVMQALLASFRGSYLEYKRQHLIGTPDDQLDLDGAGDWTWGPLNEIRTPIIR